MNITIITLSMTSIERGMYYNSQDQGLGKALALLGNYVDIYNFVKEKQGKDNVIAQNCTVHYVTSKSFGYHAINRADFLTGNTDCVICFSDNQLLFRHIFNKCRKLGIKCFPYVGVIGSNNSSGIKSTIMNCVSNNISLYKKNKVLAKTPDVLNKMKHYGINNVVLCPVCLDENTLNKDFDKYSKKECKEYLGYQEEDKILLFVGRLQQEKNPLKLLEIFSQFYMENRLKLVMISSGELLSQVEEKINQLKLNDKVVIIPRVDNKDMWRYYRASDLLINLNPHEIFGMSLLEAMYYGCPIAAVSAPGPDFILESDDYGILCKNADELSRVIKNTYVSDCGRNEQRIEKAHDRVMEKFLWKATADIIMKIM